MNLGDYRQTSVLTALDRVRTEAEALGARVVRSEVIGLMPEAAALEVAREALLLPEFGKGNLIEGRLEAVVGARFIAP
jgi:glutamate formiminotransferase